MTYVGVWRCGTGLPQHRADIPKGCGKALKTKRQLTIALDAMGGDEGPGMVIPGAALAAVRHPEFRFLLFGDRARIAPLLEHHPKLKDQAEIRHTDVFIAMDAKPSQALRQGRGKSSMWQTIEAVKLGEADVAVSAGNTGALMAMARFILKTLPGISRPAIAAIWPTLKSESIVLDVGATIGADARQLVEFAVMGEAMARSLFGVEKPSVGLLNIGVEEIKGVEQVKAAAQMLRELDIPIEYAGFIEGDDIGQGKVDVVVTEGFTGNIALKTAEGLDVEARRGAGLRRFQGPQGPHGPAQAQWRRVPRTQRRGGEEPRRHRCAGLRHRHRCRL